MMKLTRRQTVITLATLVGIGIVVGTWLAISLLHSPFDIDEPAYIYVRPSDTEASIRRQLTSEAHATSTLGWRVANILSPLHLHTGRYIIRPDETWLTVYRRMARGHQEPTRLTLPATRGMNRLAGAIGHRLMLDSADVALAFADSSYAVMWGYTPATLPALFIPDTYEVYWDISLDALMERLQRENAAFWNSNGRDAQAAALGLTHEEVCTLASIVDEETAADAEKPDVAGLYLNRLRAGMPLQADPTVKFAVGDESLQRITGAHLAVESPYNTYLHVGLPPGPIRIASKAAIDAVLHATPHTYIYMCAREDFSGRHNFATTFAQHQQNARRYQRALNARGIK